MKTRKRRIELLSFYNHTGIEKHLEEMARKGWMIERISNFFWTYRKIEPQELQVAVTYFPKASEFDSGPSEAQQRLLDFCAGTGWELACTWFQMQIFYNSAADPTPIHTDPALEVDAIHRACKANYLRSMVVLLVISLVMALLFLSSLISDTLRILASPGDLLTGTGWLCLLLLSAVELAVYFTWRRRAKKAAEHGLFLDTPTTTLFQQILAAIFLLFLVYWAANLVMLHDPLMAWIAVLMYAAIFVSIFLTGAVRRLVKRIGLSSAANRLLTACACFLLAFVFINAVVSFGVQLAKTIPRETLPLYVEVPLRVGDLLDTEYSDYITTLSPDESLLLSRLEIHQRHGFDDEPSPEIPELSYEVFIVKVPALYGFFESQMKRLIVLSAFWKGDIAETEAAPWGADRAYRLVMEDGREENTYLLCYGDRLVRIGLNWTPDAGQMAVAGERLATAWK